MKEFFQIAGQVAGLGGIAIIVFLAVGKAIVSKTRDVNQGQSYALLNKLLTLATIITILGMISWLVSLMLSRNRNSEPEFTYKGTITIRKFDLRDKYTNAPEVIEFGPFTADSWPQERDRIVSTFMEKLKAVKYPEIKFAISGHNLEVSQHVVLWLPPAEDVQGVGSWSAHADIKPHSPFNLEELFSSRSGKQQEMMFRCADRVFATSQMTIEESDGVYAFLIDGSAKSEFVVSPRLKRIMLDSFVGKGNSISDGFAAELNNVLKLAIGKEESLSLSSYSMDEFEKIRSELMQWPHHRSNKGFVVERYAVDVILSSSITAIPMPSNK